MQPPSTTRGTVQLLHRSFIRFRDRLHVLSHVLLTKTLRGVARSFHFKYLRQFNTLLYLPFMALEHSDKVPIVFSVHNTKDAASRDTSPFARNAGRKEYHTLEYLLFRISNAMNAKVVCIGKHKVSSA